MEKNTLKENINHLCDISSKMPKTISEAINFEGNDDMEMMRDEPAPEVGNEKTLEHHGDSGMDVMAFVDDIRKKSLKGMAQLADNPDDERYQLLKKIWQICDKKPEQQTAFSNPAQKPQQPQGGSMM